MMDSQKLRNRKQNWGCILAGAITSVGIPWTQATTSEVMYQFSPGTEASLESLYAFNCSNSTCFLNDSLVNSTFNETLLLEGDTEPLADIILMGILSIVLGLMILVTVIGNVFVIAAILLERNLQNVANYLIVSLAVADLMVACLVMPLGAVYVISNNWIMGPELCDMWTSIDVLCCTASILHLVAIAVDRFWAVTNVDYIHTRNVNRIGIMIVVVWIIALVVSLSPQIPQFKDPDYLHRIHVKKQCLVSQDLKYQIFATSSTFYVPLLVIFILYWKIFQTARKRIRRRKEGSFQVVNESGNGKVSRSLLAKKKFLNLKRFTEKKSSAADALVNSLVMMEGQSTTTTLDVVEEQEDSNSKQETTAFTISKRPPSHQETSPETLPVPNNGSVNRTNSLSPSCPASVDKLIPSRKEKKETLAAKRERKAAKTLAIITGAFVMCWLPFFILALLLPLCGDSCNISGYIMSFALWLGYFNSTLNPVIYTIFSPEFRQAFKRILCGGHGAGRTYRSGKMR